MNDLEGFKKILTQRSANAQRMTDLLHKRMVGGLSDDEETEFRYLKASLNPSHVDGFLDKNGYIETTKIEGKE